MLRLFFMTSVICAVIAQAAVSRIDMTERADLPIGGYERIGGKAYFAIDPKLAANKAIVDVHWRREILRVQSNSPPIF
jgi:hypothetical protein